MLGAHTCRKAPKWLPNRRQIAAARMPEHRGTTTLRECRRALEQRLHTLKLEVKGGTVKATFELPAEFVGRTKLDLRIENKKLGVAVYKSLENK